VSDLLPLMRALRVSYDEVQFTRAIHAFASSDPLFARSLANLILDEAAGGLAPAAVRAKEFSRFSGSPKCERERRVGSGEDDRGRCDLWVTTDETPRATLAVEVKLYAGYTTRQRERYMDELDRRRRGGGGLVVVTNRPQQKTPAALVNRKRWLGEVTWGALYTAGLAKLPFSSPGSGIGPAWPALVEVLREDGDIGGTAGVDVEALAAWASRKSGASRGAARDLLEALATDAGVILDKVVKQYGLRARARPATKSGWLVYALSPAFLQLGWGLKSGTAEHVQLLVKPDENAPADSRLVLETWFRPRPRQAVVWRANGKAPAGFRLDEYWGWWHRTAYIDSVGDANAIEVAILKKWKTSIIALDRHRAFDDFAADC
jgi:hypothetical protein